jgi:hypothetical protein
MVSPRATMPQEQWSMVAALSDRPVGPPGYGHPRAYALNTGRRLRAAPRCRRLGQAQVAADDAAGDLVDAGAAVAGMFA